MKASSNPNSAATTPRSCEETSASNPSRTAGTSLRISQTSPKTTPTIAPTTRIRSSQIGTSLISPRSTCRSDAHLGRDAAGRHRLLQGAVVPFVLVRVRLGEHRHGVVEGAAAAEIGGDVNSVPRPRVSPCERPAADSAVGLEPRGIHRLDLGRALGVPELADVEVPLLAVDRDDPLPPEHHVGRGLHHPLPLDYALPVLDELALAEKRFEHRCLRLLELEEERIGLVAARQEQDPGSGTHAADTDHLTSSMDVAIALEQMTPVARQRPSIGADHAPNDVLELLPLRMWQDILDRGDEGRVADDPELTVDRAAQLGERSHAVFRVHAGNRRLKSLHLLAGDPCSEL